jgi:hypothetical protein
MGSRHTSGNHGKHPYMRADKVNRFWHETRGRWFGYSQNTKDEMDRLANEFILENSNAKRSQWTKK